MVVRRARAGITIFQTLMNSGDNKQIIVPNSNIYEGTITNYSTTPTRRIDLVIGLGYIPQTDLHIHRAAQKPTEKSVEQPQGTSALR